MNVLSGSTGFQDRVKMSLLSACVAIKSESPVTVPFHRERETFLVGVEAQPDIFKVQVAGTVATDAAVIGAATQAGTVVLTSTNIVTQAGLVTDVQIDNAVSSQFNSFFRTPAN